MMNKDVIQQQCLQELEKHYRRSCNVSMGVGKTRIGIKDMDREYQLGARRFLVVIPKNSIKKTWIDEAKIIGKDYLIPCMSFTTYLSINKQNPSIYEVVYLDEYHNLLDSHNFFLGFYTGKILGLTGTAPKNKNSEKGMLEQKYCPNVFSYVINDAVDDNILNNYRVYVHMLELDTRKNIPIETKFGKFFYTSEYDSYDYWNKKLSSVRGEEAKMLRIRRMRMLMEFPTKATYTSLLLNRIKDKCIVFCNTHKQADELCQYSFHSKNKNSNKYLEWFNEGKIMQLSCVQQLSEGINMKALKQGIILHAYGNERKLNQRLGRMLRLPVGQEAIIHVLCYKNTVDEDWVSSALSDLDASKIHYIENIFKKKGLD